MPYLKYHPAEESETDPYRFPGRFGRQGARAGARGAGRAGGSPRRAGRLSFTDDETDPVAEVERAMEKVDVRLKNLRELVDQFGLDGDDGPRAA